jgi:hypothetical protein
MSQKMTTWADLKLDDGGYYNPDDLKAGSDTVQGWSRDLVENAQTTPPKGKPQDPNKKRPR